MGKAIMIATWLASGQAPVVQQVPVVDMETCLKARDLMQRDHERLPKGSPVFMGYCLPASR